MFVIFFLIGLGITIFGGIKLLQAYESENWPQVEGKIVKSEIKIGERRDEGRTYTVYSPAIEYKYVVNDEEYSNNQISSGFDQSSRSRSSAESRLRPYPLNSSVNVYYNPEAFHDSRLEVGADFSNYIVTGIGLIFFLVSFVLLFVKTPEKSQIGPNYIPNTDQKSQMLNEMINQLKGKNKSRQEIKEIINRNPMFDTYEIEEALNKEFGPENKQSDKFDENQTF
jgi:hypothetical protein